MLFTVPIAKKPGRHNSAVRELVGICGKTNIKLCITQITIDEIDAVVYGIENNALRNFDKIPAELSKKVGNDFYESYLEGKKKNLGYCAADLFKPFHDLKDTLSVENIDVCDFDYYDDLMKEADKANYKKVFNSKSLEIRKKAKGPDSLRHDIFHYLLVMKKRKDDNSKNWFLTLDASLPYVATELQEGEEPPFCISLDILIQSFSAYISDDRDIAEFSEVFSRQISNQLFPSTKLFDIRDFVLFNDIGIEIDALPEKDVEEALYHLKKYVLKGRVYTSNDLEKVTYELRKLFRKSGEKDEKIRQLIDEKQVLNEKHKEELKIKDREKEIALEEIKKAKEKEDFERKKNNEDERQRRRKYIVWHIIFTVYCLIFASALYYMTVLADKYSEGNNILIKMENFWVFYTLWGIVVLFIYDVLWKKFGLEGEK